MDIQLTPQQQQALAFDTQEKELAYKARFASNLAYSQSQNIRGPASFMNASSGAQSPSIAENSAMAPNNAGEAMCQRCSPDLSEWAPATIITTSAIAYGIAVHNPMVIVPTPDKFRIREGSQKVIP